jgi:hypothetical protein
MSQFFSSAFPRLAGGIPRGLNLSATLAELAMREFDDEVRALPTVYFYARYVDDMILFTFDDPDRVKANIQSVLPTGLALNEEKTAILRVTSCRCELRCNCGKKCRCIDKCSCKPADGNDLDFDFLGYNFSFSSITSKTRTQSVVVSMAAKKVAKIKTRLIRSLREYVDHRDFELLYDRIRFLTANHEVSTSSSEKKVKSGVFFSYPLLSAIEDPQGRTVPPVILSLDHFWQAALFAKRTSFGQRINATLSPTQKMCLQKLSFRSGFCSKRLIRFSSARIRQLKECWEQ